jgi:hypothetical protein
MGSIAFRCESCHKAYRVGSEKAGLRTKCIACGARLTIPFPHKEAETQVRQPTQESEDKARPMMVEPLAVQEQSKRRRPMVPKGNDEPDEKLPKKTLPKGRREETEPGLDEDQRETVTWNKRSQRRPSGEEEEETAEEERPRRGKRRRKRAGDWRKVRLGLLLLIVGLGISIGASLLSRIAFMFIGLANLRAFFTWLQFFSFIMLCQGMVALVGYCFCLFAPSQYSCRKLALALLVVGSLHVLANLLDPFNLTGMHFDTGKWLEQIEKGNFSGLDQMLASINSWVLRIRIWAVSIQLLGYVKLFVFPVFLWSVARCLKARGLDENCISLAKLSVGTMALGLFWQFLFRIVHFDLQFILVILAPLSWISALLGLAQTVLTFLILINTRRAIEDVLDE